MDTDTRIPMHGYRCMDTDTRIPMHGYRYKDTDAWIPIQGYRYKDTNVGLSDADSSKAELCADTETGLLIDADGIPISDCFRMLIATDVKKVSIDIDISSTISTRSSGTHRRSFFMVINPFSVVH